MTNDPDQDYYRQLCENLYRQSNYLDNALLTLSSGGIGLIMMVLKDKDANLDCYLKISSFAFFLTITLVLASGYCSVKAHQRSLKCLSENKPVEIDQCPWNYLCEKLTLFSFILFPLGCIILIIKFI